MSRWALVLLAGWLADSLSSTDGDVDKALASYESGEHDAAVAALDAAEARLGERPELHYDRGLVLMARAGEGDLEAARRHFEHGTESDRPQVLASSHYELGNLDFDAEDYAAAVEHYIECLKAQPSHESAKWNLELAQRLQEEQEKQQEEQEKDQEKNEDGDGEPGEDGEEGDQEDQEQEEDEEDGETGDEEEQGETGDEEEQGETGEDEQGESGGEQEEGEEEEQSGQPDQPDDQEQGDQGDQEGGEQPPPDGEKEQGEPDAPQPQEGEAESQPGKIQRADIGDALDELDTQDNFMLGRPKGRPKKVTKDW
jgi:Ca-activated chloride channel family protein